MNKLLLIDSNSLINKAFYALPPLTSLNGTPTGAVVGFFNMLTSLIEMIKPTHIVAAFDLHEITFRKKLYPEYKAGRDSMKSELILQFPIVKNILNYFGIKICELPGWEADDIIGTLSKRFEENTFIVSGDKDMLQLVDETTEVWLSTRGVSEITKRTLSTMTDLSPAQVIDYKALAGDASDNIKGVKGIGDKAARELIGTFGSVEAIYNNIDMVRGKIKEKLLEDKESAFLSKRLATIDINAPINCLLEDAEYKGVVLSADAVSYMQNLGLYSTMTNLSRASLGRSF